MPPTAPIASRAPSSWTIVAIEKRLGHVEETLGEAPNEATGEAGRGVMGVLVEVRRTQLEDLAARAKQREIDEALAAAAEKRRRRWAALIGIPSFAVLVSVIVGLVKLWELVP